MADRPIIFSAPMVRALLDGRKTQHRVPLYPQPSSRHAWQDCVVSARLVVFRDPHGWRQDRRLPYAVGDRLFPAPHLTLTVTNVRVQRVQEISRGDALDEGCEFANMSDGPDPRDWFRDLWNSINAKRGFGWDADPWVVALTFDVREENIDG